MTTSATRAKKETRVSVGAKLAEAVKGFLKVEEGGERGFVVTFPSKTEAHRFFIESTVQVDKMCGGHEGCCWTRRVSSEKARETAKKMFGKELE